MIIIKRSAILQYFCIFPWQLYLYFYFYFLWFYLLFFIVYFYFANQTLLQNANYTMTFLNATLIIASDYQTSKIINNFNFYININNSKWRVLENPLSILTSFFRSISRKSVFVFNFNLADWLIWWLGNLIVILLFIIKQFIRRYMTL